MHQIVQSLEPTIVGIQRCHMHQWTRWRFPSAPNSTIKHTNTPV